MTNDQAQNWTIARVIKVGVLALAALIALALLIGAIFLNNLFSAKSDYDLRIEHPALTNAVIVQRDEFAIPHIEAQSEEDAFFALGFVHAQDRFWQMTVTKHFTQGRLTELFGEAVLDADISARTLNLGKKIDEAWAAMPEQDRARVDAYAAGVTAWLDSPAYVRPVEFGVLGLDPEPWTARDSLFASMSTLVTLTQGVGMEEIAERISQLSFERESLVEGGYPQDGHVALSLSDLQRTMGFDLTEVSPVDEPNPINLLQEFENSNNWVVSGARTESGLPILAGDPHLAMGMPGIWYLARLNWPDYAMAGGTVAGVPVIYMGLVNNIATAATINPRDTQDVYLEQLNPDNPEQYLTPDGWENFEQRVEAFRFASGETIEREFLVSRNGPILPKTVYDAEALHGQGYVGALAWTALRETPNLTLSSLIQMNRAKTTEDWLAAMCGYVGPDVNIAFAHSDGTTGLLVAGRNPIRKTTQTHGGARPSLGAQDANLWDGMHACSNNALVMNPESGMIVTANARVIPDGFPFAGRHYPAPPGRQQRIDDLLLENTSHTVDSMASVQLDGLSLDTERLLEVMRAVSGETPDEIAAVEALQSWDANWVTEDAGPAVYVYWSEALAQAVLGDELDDYEMITRVGTDTVLARIINENLSWCDDVRTEFPETCEDVLPSSLARAVSKSIADHGVGPAQLNWHEVYRLKHPHVGFADIPFIGDWFSRYSSRSDGIGVAAGTGAPNITVVKRGENGEMQGSFGLPSLRLVIDLADLDQSVFVIPSGQSGYFRSPHYDDLQGLWERGELVTIPRRLDAEQVRYETVLAPAN